MTYIIKLTKQAQKDYKKIKQTNLLNKIIKIVNLIKLNPFDDSLSYEKLSGNLKNYYSRRINIKHRFVYKVDEKKKTVLVLRMWTHYD